MITVKTKIHPGIAGVGGQTLTSFEASTGPRNLLAAIRHLGPICAERVRQYGNEGCGRTWIEIDGRDVRDYEIDEIFYSEAKTSAAKELIARSAKNPAAAALGRLGGKVKSEKKTATARANGAKGGRKPGKKEAK
jgi:hypothetical protein